jgi:hypothetical protein
MILIIIETCWSVQSKKSHKLSQYFYLSTQQNKLMGLFNGKIRSDKLFCVILYNEWPIKNILSEHFFRKFEDRDNVFISLQNKCGKISKIRWASKKCHKFSAKHKESFRRQQHVRTPTKCFFKRVSDDGAFNLSNDGKQCRFNVIKNVTIEVSMQRLSVTVRSNDA